MRVLYLAVAVVGLASSCGNARASEPQVPIRPESRVWITGASNIRRFTCEARRLEGSVDLRGVTTRGPLLSGTNVSDGPSLDVTVDRLDCGVRVMNRHLRDALQGARHPRIEFRVATYEADLTAPDATTRIVGLVTIAGVQRPVTVTAAVRADTLGRLRVQGVYVIRPTEFGIQPPRRFGGLLRVRDRIVVHFDIAVDPDCSAVERITTAPTHSPAFSRAGSDHASHL